MNAGDGNKHRDDSARNQLGARLNSRIMQRIFNEARRKGKQEITNVIFEVSHNRIKNNIFIQGV